ncbi:nucleoid-structuring protein H-NS [Sphingobium sp. TomMM35A]
MHRNFVMMSLMAVALCASLFLPDVAQAATVLSPHAFGSAGDIACAAAVGMVGLGPMTAAERRKGRYLRAPDGHPALTKEFTEAIEAQFAKLDDKVEDALRQAKAADAIALELAQKVDGDNRPGTSRHEESWGDQFVKSLDQLEEVGRASAQGRRASWGMEIKATVTTGAESGGPIGAAPYRDGAVMMPRRQLRVRNLIPVIGITSGAVEYPKQTTRTNNAAMVPETTIKPESAYGFTMETAVPKVIAHWVPASKQALEDGPQLRGIIDTELVHGLDLKEDEQLVNGSGTGENLDGLVTNATAFNDPIDLSSPTMIDTIGVAILQGTLADFVPSGIIMHPSDWMRIRLLKDGDGKYLLGEPGAQIEPRLFGLPVVPTASMATDKFLIGDFQAAATIYDRWSTRIEVSTEHADFFVRNMVAILAERRLAQAIKQPGALIYGDFGNVT